MKKGFLEELRQLECKPVYERLQAETNPIFIWGCGALVEHIYNYCKYYGIQIEACFVNSQLVKRKFHDLDVLTLDEVLEGYSQFSVIIGHSNYVDGRAYLEGITNIAEVYCVTSCCYGIWRLISPDFLQDNAALLDAFYRDLPDEESRDCLKSYFESRMADNAEYMFPYFKKETSYFLNNVVTLTENEVLLDVGACEGNVIWPFIDAVNQKYRKIIALEPEDENYDVLLRNIETHGIRDIIPKKVCAYCENGQVKFSGNKEAGGIIETADEYRLYPAVTIDSLCEELGPDCTPSIIKINFPFSVPEILYGAKGLMRSYRPKVIIRAGFDEKVLLQTYKAIRQLNPHYQIYLRYTIGIPQGLTLFAI